MERFFGSSGRCLCTAVFRTEVNFGGSVMFGCVVDDAGDYCCGRGLRRG